MKMTKEHFEHVKESMEAVMIAYPKAYDQYKMAGLSNMRYRWDVFRAADLLPFTCSHLYKYLNDNHIDTALRKITKTD